MRSAASTSAGSRSASARASGPRPSPARSRAARPSRSAATRSGTARATAATAPARRRRDATASRGATVRGAAARVPARGGRTTCPAAGGSLALTQPWKLALVAVAALLVLSAGLHGCAADDATAAPGTAPGAAARATLAPSHEPTQAVAPAAELTPTVPTSVPTPASDGITRSHAVGDGTFTVAPVTDAAAEPSASASVTTPSTTPAGGERTFAVAVEHGTGLDVTEVAETVTSVLTDPRGWSAVDAVTFRQVGDQASADVVVVLATPNTVDELCAGQDTQGAWSCTSGNRLVLNADRWRYLVPAFTDAATYRAYLINHELGTWLGHPAESCPGSGQPAPVMQAQAVDLGGCVVNAWPGSDS